MADQEAGYVAQADGEETGHQVERPPISLVEWILHEHTLLGLCFAKVIAVGPDLLMPQLTGALAGQRPSDQRPLCRWLLLRVRR